LSAQRTGAQNDYLLAGNAAINLLIVFAKLFAVIGFEPGCIAADAQTLITALQCLMQFRGPPPGNALQIELVFR
jgi:hypothetical protein